MSLNMRYCLTIMPLLAILCAYAFRELEDKWGPCFGMPLFAFICFLTAGFNLLVTHKLTTTTDQMELPLLIVPLFLAAILAIFSFIAMASRSSKVFSLRIPAWTILIFAITWSGMTAFFYDYPFHRYVRTVHKYYSQELVKLIRKDSILFTANRSFTVAVMLKTKDRVRIAVPQYDGFKDFPKLLDFHVKAGRRVYAFFPKDLWPRLKSDFLQAYKVTPLALFPDTNFLLGKISK